MRLFIEFAQEDINSTTLSLIERLFKSTEVKTVTDSNTKTTGTTTETRPKAVNILSDPYELDEILPQPSSPTKQKQDNTERLQAFAKKIESTLNDREKKALEKFVNFYLSKINDWKPDVNIQNLWSKWVNSEK